MQDIKDDGGEMNESDMEEDTADSDDNQSPNSMELSSSDDEYDDDDEYSSSGMCDVGEKANKK